MRRASPIFFCPAPRDYILCGVCLLLFSASAARAEPLDDARRFEAFIDRHLQTLLEQQECSGAAVVAVHRGKILLCKGYGAETPENAAPIDPRRSVFRYGSLSKILVTIAVLQLADEGRLNLDDDVQRYLPDLVLPKNFSAPVTLRDCLLHTDGFDPGWLIGAVASHYVPPEEADAALARTLPPRIAAPQEAYLYGDVGFALLGRVIERTNGRPLSEYMQTAVLAPLHMTASTFKPRLPDRLAAQLAPGYCRRPQGVVRQPLFFPVYPATAGLSGAPRDLAQVMLALLERNGGAERLQLTTAALESMLTRQYSYDPSMPGATLGWYERCANGHRAIEHGGVMPGYSSHLLLLPDERFGLLLTCNQYGIDKFGPLLHALLHEYLPHGSSPPYAGAAPAALPAGGSRRDFAGRYRYMAYSHSTIVKLGVLGGLWREMSVYATDDGGLAFDRHGAYRYEEAAPDLYRRADETIRIFRNEAGRPVRLGLGYWMFEKLAWYEDVRLHRLLLAALTLGFSVALLGYAALPALRRNGDARRRRARRWLAAAAGVDLTFLLSFAMLLWIYHPLDWCFGVPAAAVVLLALPPVAAALGIFGTARWIGTFRRVGKLQSLRAGGLARGAFDLALIAGLILFSLTAHYWNAFGWRF